MNNCQLGESKMNSKKVWTQPAIKAISLNSAKATHSGGITSEGMPNKS